MASFSNAYLVVAIPNFFPLSRPINQSAKQSYISPLNICQLNVNLRMQLRLKCQLLEFFLIPVAELGGSFVGALQEL